MTRQKLTLLILLFFTAPFAWGQGIPGYNSSNYTGISGIDLQPACIADMPYKFDMNIVGAGLAFNNNYIGVNSKSLFDGTLFNSDKTKNIDVKNDLLYENFSSAYKAIGLNAYVQLPSFAIAINKNIAVGFSAKFRTMWNVDAVSPELAHLMYTGLDQNDAKNLTYWNVKLNDDQFNLNEMSWMEYGIDYAQVIKGQGPHFLKVGGRVKLVQGLEAAYFYAQDLQYSWKDSKTLSLYNAKFSYGHTDNVISTVDSFIQHKNENNASDNVKSFLNNVSKSSLALDIGAVYEWRPDYDNFVYDMDGKKGLERRNESKYKLRVGVSILDIGSVKFAKGNNTYDFLADTANWNVSGTKLGNNPAAGLDSLISRNFPNHADNKNYFVFALPTSFSVQVDYNIYKDFYLNFTSYTSPKWLNIESKVHAMSYYSITPRWDSKWFGAFLPLGINGYGDATMGATVRLGPIIVGSSNILSNMLSKNIYGQDVYFAAKIPIFCGKPPRDKDHDGVSDKYDKCRDKKGTWAHHGCPDTDGDGVYDDVDKCPNDPGPVENHGCPLPDADGDGVPDNVDNCPTVKGPVENHGCPWGDADKDGVTDNLDSCPNVAGPAANHGCPWGDADNDGVPDNVDNCPDIAGPAANHGCPWGDADNDGVTDNLDSCPHTPGPASNHGCPVLAKKTQEVVNTAFKDLQFETSKDIILPSSIESLNKLAKLMLEHPEFKLRLSGYTDNVGSDEKNMKLSKDRAMSVKKKLVDKGVDPNRIKVEWHGKNNPIAPNTTEKGRAKNRRVEMKIIFD